MRLCWHRFGARGMPQRSACTIFKVSTFTRSGNSFCNSYAREARLFVGGVLAFVGVKNNSVRHDVVSEVDADRAHTRCSKQ